MEESVAATGAKVLAATKPGSMAVRAYLQLPSLKKAPPEVGTTISTKKPNKRDNTSNVSVANNVCNLCWSRRARNSGPNGHPGTPRAIPREYVFVEHEPFLRTSHSEVLVRLLTRHRTSHAVPREHLAVELEHCLRVSRLESPFGCSSGMKQLVICYTVLFADHMLFVQWVAQQYK